MRGRQRVARAPELDARVRFDQRGEDDNGDRLGPFEDGFEVWANVDYLRGSESAVANRLQGSQPVTILVRETPQTRDVTNAMRAVAISGRGLRDGEVFNITAVAPAQEVGFLNIMATSGGAAG